MKIPVLLGASVLALGACSPEPTPLPDISAQQTVAIPSITSANVGYQPPFAGFQNHSPTGPVSWRGVNDAQSEAN
ncbi:hypothetical protein [Sedimentitalea nanhaiensis]|uniref:Uncharacterized protein n=1 Tax=Sedimentitalea nanhaiensis TaxID=999627 RepID=A0A1I7DF00_9RHOB|nr:hypothetical protein [Sedimentitalea nanhaiensis]SFU10311.1 hypothetical protein SAMN05216236_12718 [Sedimentitalea nanhaiensis]